MRERVRGKLVGRVGVEPTTKRLRESLPTAKFPHKTAQSPLIEVLKSASKDPAFHLPLRGIITCLLVIAVLAALIVGALSNWHTPEPHIPAIGSFHCEASGRLPCDRGRQ